MSQPDHQLILIIFNFLNIHRIKLFSSLHQRNSPIDAVYYYSDLLLRGKPKLFLGAIDIVVVAAPYATKGTKYVMTVSLICHCFLVPFELLLSDFGLEADANSNSSCSEWSYAELGYLCYLVVQWSSTAHKPTVSRI